jgi:probable phosphoglycerate mutase
MSDAPGTARRQRVTRVLLVRHGGTVSTVDDKFAGASDVALSDDGRRQIALLGQRLASRRIDAAYCSDLRRAVDTAAAVTNYHPGLTTTALAALREVDHGHWEGRVHADVERQFADEYAMWSADPLTYAPPGGETGYAVLNRALPALRQIVAEHPGQSVLVVSHKATNRLLIGALLGIDVRRYRDRLAQDLACLNVLDFVSPTEARAVTINDTSHYAG